MKIPRGRNPVHVVATVWRQDRGEGTGPVSHFSGHFFIFSGIEDLCASGSLQAWQRDPPPRFLHIFGPRLSPTSPHLRSLLNPALVPSPPSAFSPLEPRPRLSPTFSTPRPVRSSESVGVLVANILPSGGWVGRTSGRTREEDALGLVISLVRYGQAVSVGAHFGVQALSPAEVTWTRLGAPRRKLSPVKKPQQAQGRRVGNWKGGIQSKLPSASSISTAIKHPQQTRANFGSVQPPERNTRLIPRKSSPVTRIKYVGYGDARDPGEQGRRPGPSLMAQLVVPPHYV